MATSFILILGMNAQQRKSDEAGGKPSAFFASNAK